MRQLTVALLVGVVLFAAVWVLAVAPAMTDSAAGGAANGTETATETGTGTETGNWNGSGSWWGGISLYGSP